MRAREAFDLGERRSWKKGTMALMWERVRNCLGTGQEGHRDRDLRLGPDHLPAEPRPPHAGSPAPTAPAALATSFNNTVWHLIGS